MDNETVVATIDRKQYASDQFTFEPEIRGYLVIEVPLVFFLPHLDLLIHVRFKYSSDAVIFAGLEQHRWIVPR